MRVSRKVMAAQSDLMEVAVMHQRPVLANITEEIGHQVELLQHEGGLVDMETVRARLEAIRQFASQGLHFIEQKIEERPKANGSASVK